MMLTAFDAAKNKINAHRATWLVTGAAGFIGSHLVENLLALGQRVVGLDNFLTGFESNIEDVMQRCSPDAKARFELIRGDIRVPADCARAVKGADYVLHQAALGSVSRSVADPVPTTSINVDGFVNVLEAARKGGVKRIVFASSSSVYGDAAGETRRESELGRLLSPYAVSKMTNEMHAGVYARLHGLPIVGLRYFNVFGPRQDPDGAYAAVIPKWIQDLFAGRAVTVNGDGLTSRDFCFVDNVVQANLLAALTEDDRCFGQMFNVACNAQTSLIELHALLAERVALAAPKIRPGRIVHSEFRAGDIRHSRADITKARQYLGYEPGKSLREGLDLTVPWFAGRSPRPATIVNPTL